MSILEAWPLFLKGVAWGAAFRSHLARQKQKSLHSLKSYVAKLGQADFYTQILFSL